MGYKMKCPLCKQEESYKIIYFGLPMFLCKNKECNCVWGFWSFITNFVGFNGWIFTYEDSYWKALWHWLVDSENE